MVGAGDTHPSLVEIVKPTPPAATPPPSKCDANFSSSHAIVTACSSNHMLSLRWFFFYAEIHAPCETLILYSLGMTELHLRQVALFSPPNLIVRRFNFTQFPPHFDMTRNAGEYAWKPAIVSKVLEEFEFVVWLDSGSYVKAPLKPLYSHLASHGFYSTISRGSVERWSHPGTLAHFGVNQTNSEILGREPCNGAFLGFSHNQTLKELVIPWNACGLNLSCIAPEGSNMQNHRQDQAALTLLVLLSSQRFKCQPVKGVDSVVSLQQDNRFKKKPPFDLGGLLRPRVNTTLRALHSHNCQVAATFGSKPGCKQDDPPAAIDLLALLPTLSFNPEVQTRLSLFGPDVRRLEIPLGLVLDYAVQHIALDTFSHPDHEDWFVAGEQTPLLYFEDILLADEEVWRRLVSGMANTTTAVVIVATKAEQSDDFDAMAIKQEQELLRMLPTAEKSPWEVLSVSATAHLSSIEARETDWLVMAIATRDGGLTLKLKGLITSTSSTSRPSTRVPIEVFLPLVHLLFPCSFFTTTITPHLVLNE